MRMAVSVCVCVCVYIYIYIYIYIHIHVVLGVIRISNKSNIIYRSQQEKSWRQKKHTRARGRVIAAKHYYMHAKSGIAQNFIAHKIIQNKSHVLPVALLRVCECRSKPWYAVTALLCTHHHVHANAGAHILQVLQPSCHHRQRPPLQLLLSINMIKMHEHKDTLISMYKFMFMWAVTFSSAYHVPWPETW